MICNKNDNTDDDIDNTMMENKRRVVEKQQQQQQQQQTTNKAAPLQQQQQKLGEKEEEDDELYPQRIVSLLGAATEIICRLGLSDRLVGRSHECDYPPNIVLKLPCVSRPKLDIDNSTSKEIDEMVRNYSAMGDTVYKLDDSTLMTLDADLLITQDHCRVCAITPTDIANISGDNGDNNNNNAQTTRCRNIPQLILKPSTLEDCIENVNDIATALGVPHRGKLLVDTMRHRMHRIEEVVRTIQPTAATRTRTKTKPRVALLEWFDPIMGCGYWLPELVSTTGGIPLHCPPIHCGAGTPTIPFQKLLDSKPDVVIFALCGFSLTRSAMEIQKKMVTSLSSSSSSSSSSSPSLNNENDTDNNNQMTQLAAVLPCGRESIFVVDGNYLMNRSGPRLVESMEVVAEAIHPALQGHFGHYGTELLTHLHHAWEMAEQGQQTGSTKIRPSPFLQQQPQQPQATTTTTTTTTPTTTPTITPTVTTTTMTKALSTKGNNSVVSSGNNENNNENDRVSPHQSPKDVVSRQLYCLESGRFEEAFALNSSANQSRWCSSERFVTVLRNHPEFCKLLGTEKEKNNENDTTSTKAIILEERINEEDGGVAMVRVAVPESTMELTWTMVTEKRSNNKQCEGGATEIVYWRTENVK